MVGRLVLGHWRTLQTEISGEGRLSVLQMRCESATYRTAAAGSNAAPTGGDDAIGTRSNKHARFLSGSQARGGLALSRSAAQRPAAKDRLPANSRPWLRNPLTQLSKRRPTPQPSSSRDGKSGEPSRSRPNIASKQHSSHYCAHGATSNEIA